MEVPGLRKNMNTRMYSKNRTVLGIIVENGIPKSDDIFDVAMAETKIKTDTKELPIFIEGGGQ